MRLYVVRFRIREIEQFRDQLVTVQAHDAGDALTIAAVKMYGSGYTSERAQIVDIDTLESAVAGAVATETPS